jgi:hypothetical protein
MINKQTKNNMKTISRISVQNKIENHLTSTEKKVIIYMLNENMNNGKSRNKFFSINKLENNFAEITISQNVQSIMLNKIETISSKTLIQYN